MFHEPILSVTELIMDEWISKALMIDCTKQESSPRSSASLESYLVKHALSYNGLLWKCFCNLSVFYKEIKPTYLPIDEKLSWKDHIDYLIISLSKFYGVFNKIKYFVPKKHKLAIHNAYILSKICYGIEFMGLWLKLCVIGFRSFLTSCWRYCSIWVLFIAQTSCIKN